MDEKKIHKNFLNEPPPVDIPSPDEAWQNMQQKLEEEEKEKPVVAWWLYPAAIILLLVVTAFWFWSIDFTNQNRTSKTIVINGNIPKKTGTEKDKLYKEKNLTGEKEAQQRYNRTNNIQSNNQHRKNGAEKQTKATVSKQQRETLKTPPIIKTEATQKTKPAVEGFENVKDKGISKSNTNSGKSTTDSVERTVTSHDKKEAIQEVIESKDEYRGSDKMIDAGLEWTAQIPMNGTTGYFAGPGGSSQSYRLLFPAFWISLQAERSAFTLYANPFATAVLSDKPYSVKNTISGSNAIVESRTLHKIFGTTAGFSYDYNIKERWWLGSNMQGSFWHSGTGTIKGEKMNSSNGSTSVIYNNNYSLNDSAWADFTRFQVGAGFQLLYKLPKWQAGIRFDYTFVPLIDKEGQKNKTAAIVFIRWRLYSNRKKN